MKIVKSLCKYFLALLLILEGSIARAVDNSKNPAESMAQDVVIESSRVISCAIHFPLDSVKFSEAQVTRCIKSANIDDISYVHVIATATSSGTGTHNLYLSTRRAGAVEAFINNRYPKLKVHAFGGGENPKFGKVARIFIVENQRPSTEIRPGVQVAKLGSPEIIERIKTKVITKTEYKPEPPLGYVLGATVGRAETSLNSAIYGLVSVSVGKTLAIPLLGESEVGGRYQILQSNEAVDINKSSVFVKKSWYLSNLYKYKLFISQTVEAGILKANGSDWDIAGQSLLDVRQGNLRGFIGITKSNYITSFGSGLGVML